MKTLIIVFCIFSVPSFGQKVKSGVAPFDRKERNMISITFKGSGVAPFVEKINSDLGAGMTYNDGGEGFPGIRWIGVQHPDWGNLRIIIQMYWVAMEGKQIALISCINADGDDLLLPDTEFTNSLKKYFKRRLK